MNGQKVWEYYIILPTNDSRKIRNDYPFIDFILSESGENTNVNIFNYDDDGCIMLYAIAPNKKSKKVFEKERNMKMFIVKEIMLLDDFEYVEYCDINAFYIFDVSSNYEYNPLVTRKNSNTVDGIKYSRAISSLTRGERMIIDKIIGLEDDPVIVRIMTKCMSILRDKDMLDRISHIVIGLGISDILEVDDFKKGYLKAFDILNINTMINYINYTIGASGAVSESDMLSEMINDESDKIYTDELLLSIYLYGNTYKM